MRAALAAILCAAVSADDAAQKKMPFLDADVAALSARARHELRRHWAGNPRARKPRFLVNDEMLASLPLLQVGLCRFEGRFRFARRPPPVPRRRPFGVIFVGDSTMRNLFHALCLAMNARQRGDDQGAQPVAACAGRLSVRGGADGTGPDMYAAYAGSTNVDPGAVGRAAGVLGAPVDAVVFGAGLWLQWPTPFAPALHAWTSYAGFVGYETTLQQAVAQYARDAPGSVILAATTHSQCDAAFTHDFRRVADDAKARGRERASAGCAAWLRDHLNGVDAVRDCVAGLRGREASRALNARLRGALPDLGVVDTFALTDGRCEKNLPGDAIHFHGLLYDELTLVLEALGWRPTAEPAGCPRARRGWNASSPRRRGVV